MHPADPICSKQGLQYWGDGLWYCREEYKGIDPPYQDSYVVLAIDSPIITNSINSPMLLKVMNMPSMPEVKIEHDASDVAHRIVTGKLS